MSATLRLLQPTDSFEVITSLLHEAYKPLADAGMRFYASHQSPEETQRRCLEGECWLAFLGSALVGTITWRRGGERESAPWYQSDTVAIFGQFAIEPSLQCRGLGAQMLQKVEAQAREAGIRELSCDTAETAHRLIRYYERLGFRAVAKTKWKVTNYESVILSRAL